MKPAYPHLLQPIKIGNFVLKNRMQSSNSMPHFSQGPEKYPADATIAHYMGRARTGAAFVTFAGVEDTYQMPQLPDTLDMSHFPDFDARNPLCQNYLVELTEGMHAVGSLVSGSLFSANRTYRYENEQGEVEAVSANPRTPVKGSAGMGGSVGDDVPAGNLYKIIKSYGQRTALYKRLGFDAVTIHMSYRAQVPGQLLSPLTNFRTDELGGAIRHADYIPFKWTLKDYKDFLIHQVHKKGIEVRLNTRATPEMLGDDFDTVIAAVGAEPVVPRIPGIESPHVTIATDAIMHSEKIGKTVVVIGGGEVGVETGMFLAQNGRDVTVIEMRDELAADSTIMHYRSMFKTAWEAIPSFHSVLNATAKEIAADHVTYADANGVEHDIPAESVVLSVGMRSKIDEALSFYGTCRAFWIVGDCVKPGTIQTTNRSAYGVAKNV